MTDVQGTWQLVRLALRRDRIRIPVWVVGLTGVIVWSGFSQEDLYTTQAQIDAYRDLVATSPATIAMAGPALGMDTLAGIIMYETYITAIAGICIMATLFISRHTRAEEEQGRTEVIRSTEVGRHASTLAALLVTAGTCVLIGAGMAVGLSGSALGAEAATAYGAGIAVLGIVQAALTLVFAQAFVHARAVTGAGLAAFLTFYVIRGIGDVRGDWVVWLSPVGWMQRMRIPVDNTYAPLVVSLAVAALLVLLAVVLTERRDFGAGLLPQRQGPDRAPASLDGPVGLTWRLQRGPLLAWTVSLVATGAVIGALGNSMLSMIEDNPALADYLVLVEGGSVIDAYQATFALIMCLVVGGYAVWSALHLRPEEDEGRLELLLAGPLRRTHALVGHLAVTAAGTLVLVLASGLSTALTYAVVVGDSRQGFEFLWATLIYLPAILTLVGLVVLTHGWLPRWTWVGWLVLAFDLVVGWLGGLLQLPQWVMDLSAFSHLPRFPLEAFSWGPVFVLLGISAALLAGGWVGFRRRDIG